MLINETMTHKDLVVREWYFCSQNNLYLQYLETTDNYIWYRRQDSNRSYPMELDKVKLFRRVNKLEKRQIIKAHRLITEVKRQVFGHFTEIIYERANMELISRFKHIMSDKEFSTIESYMASYKSSIENNLSC